MCNNHNKLNGMAVIIEMEAIFRNKIKACDARLWYLDRQATSLRAWMEQQNLTAEQVQEKIEKAIYWHFDQAEEVSDMLIDNTPKDGTPDERVLEQEVLQQDMLDELERNSYKAQYSIEGQLHWWKALIFQREEELKLHDTIQDTLDVIPPKGKRAYQWVKYIRRCFSRIDELKKNKKLGYAGWHAFNNQLLELIGKPVMESKYEIRLLPDVIEYYTQRMETKKEELEAESLEFHQTTLEGVGVDASVLDEGNLTDA